MNEPEQKAASFYSGVGWEDVEGVTEDARRWEDLREHAREYVSACRLRVLRHLPDAGEALLDMASGPIQYPEYLEFSRHFKTRYCVDLSAQALAKAQQRIGDHGRFLHGSFFDLPLEENFFDAAVSLHTIYHMDRVQQEKAVRKLVAVTKPGRPVVIVYSNPHTLVTMPFRLARGVKRLLLGRSDERNTDLYFHAHPLVAWWERFEDVADVRLFPWRSFDAVWQKRLFPNNALGTKLLRWLFSMEDRFPDFFVRHFQYPMIVLTKRGG
jgi:SAM-dependent methyltransferase